MFNEIFNEIFTPEKNHTNLHLLIGRQLKLIILRWNWSHLLTFCSRKIREIDIGA